MKNFLNEFKAFALKGNVMDMAVGVIIGAAFQGIVTSLTNDILNPILGMAFSTDFSNVVIPLFGDASIGIGAFISAVINFKAMNQLMALGHKEEEPAPEAPKAPTQEELLADILAELRTRNENEAALTK